MNTVFPQIGMAMLSAKFILGSGLFVADHALSTVHAQRGMCTIAQIHSLVDVA